ncbi:hypothetical protein PN498_06385 [Oscillatoria sp. CS-180]|uniref:hypothetical protein n=1 Tax=Oscillatoria sp. CS-180 TaxID=3021720 RepID=UPI00232B6651|nr:hypothetical protein [Oscillatoria sp. CS-180]MDB9525608.1 hypothetical protein [Oscillatoria sp. CS-180]
MKSLLLALKLIILKAEAGKKRKTEGGSMEGQSTQKRPQLKQGEIAVFNNWNEAQKAKTKLERSELSLRNLKVEGEITPYEEVSAMGTTVGAEAGILLGAFLGGSLGVIFVSIVSTWLHGGIINSPFNQASIVVFTIAGAVLGVISGNRIRANAKPKQKQKGNPNVPRRFQLTADASTEDLAKAREMLGYAVS